MKKGVVDNLATFALFTIVSGNFIVIKYDNDKEGKEMMERVRDSVELLLKLMEN